MTLAQRRRLVDLKFRHKETDDADMIFLLDVIRQMENHEQGRTGLSPTPGPDRFSAPRLGSSRSATAIARREARFESLGHTGRAIAEVMRFMMPKADPLMTPDRIAENWADDDELLLGSTWSHIREEAIALLKLLGPHVVAESQYTPIL